MRRPLSAGERLTAGVEKLTAVLAGRSGHAAWLGLLTKPTVNGLSVWWRDALSYESGPLMIVPATDRVEAVLSVLQTELTEWKQRAAGAAQKGKPDGNRERSVRRLDQAARDRSLAKRAAAG